MRVSICRCAESAEKIVIGMGPKDDFVMSPLQRIRERGKTWWWLSLYRCAVCGQNWLVASEERRNDLYCLRKLTPTIAEEIEATDRWPDDFDRYETLLEIGRDTGNQWSYVSLEANSGLYELVRELALARPGITVGEIASLLNLEPSDAWYLAQKAFDENGLEIGNG